MIDGGYILLARQFYTSDIAKRSPHIREIFLWLCQKASYRDSGRLKRGQLICSYNTIQDELCWFIGYRRLTYTKSQCESALKYLKKNEMIAVTRTTKGMKVTICNYNIYQVPSNYENHISHTTEPSRELNQSHLLLNKKSERKEKPQKREGEPSVQGLNDDGFCPPSLEEVAVYVKQMSYDVNPEIFVSFYESKGWKVGSNQMVDWKAAARHWHFNERE